MSEDLNQLFVSEEPRVTLKEALDAWAKAADELDRPFNDFKDPKIIEDIAERLGQYFPISVLKGLVSHYTRKLEEIENVIIPDLMIQAGFPSLTTDSGLKIEIKTELNVSVQDKPRLYAWLDSIGESQIVKHELSFDRGQDIQPVLDLAMENGLSFKEDESIHPQTLKKFFKELPDEIEVPSDVITLKEFNHAVIKRSK